MIRDDLKAAQPLDQLLPGPYSNPLGSPGTHHIMDITTILNKKASVSVVAAEVQQLQQHLAQAQAADDAKSRSPSEMGSEHGSASAPPSEHQQTYPSSTQSLPQMAHLAQYHVQAQATHNNYAHSAHGSDYGRNGSGNMRPSGLPALKTFHCQTCSKGFARRSDLARHGMSLRLLLFYRVDANIYCRTHS